MYLLWSSSPHPLCSLPLFPFLPLNSLGMEIIMSYIHSFIKLHQIRGAQMKENRGFVSLSMIYFTMISSSSHVPANDIIVSFVAKPNSILQMDHIFFICFYILRWKADSLPWLFQGVERSTWTYAKGKCTEMLANYVNILLQELVGEEASVMRERPD